MTTERAKELPFCCVKEAQIAPRALQEPLPIWLEQETTRAVAAPSVSVPAAKAKFGPGSTETTLNALSDGRWVI